MENKTTTDNKTTLLFRKKTDHCGAAAIEITLPEELGEFLGVVMDNRVPVTDYFGNTDNHYYCPTVTPDFIENLRFNIEKIIDATIVNRKQAEALIDLINGKIEDYRRLTKDYLKNAYRSLEQPKCQQSITRAILSSNN